MQFLAGEGDDDSLLQVVPQLHQAPAASVDINATRKVCVCASALQARAHVIWQLHTDSHCMCCSASRLQQLGVACGSSFSSHPHHCLNSCRAMLSHYAVSLYTAAADAAECCW